MNNYVRSYADISPCGRYRYRLDREWRGTHDPKHWRWFGVKDGGGMEIGEPLSVMFVMLNPSTADGSVDDPTIRRCVGFARAMGCGRLAVANLFAFRATKPADMRAAADPVGPENDLYIMRLALEAAETGGKLICAWGTHGSFRDRDRAVMKMLAPLPIEPMSLGETADLSPRHPLYLRGDCKPLPYRGRAA